MPYFVPSKNNGNEITAAQVGQAIAELETLAIGSHVFALSKSTASKSIPQNAIEAGSNLLPFGFVRNTVPTDGTDIVTYGTVMLSAGGLYGGQLNSLPGSWKVLGKSGATATFGGHHGITLWVRVA